MGPALGRVRSLLTTEVNRASHPSGSPKRGKASARLFAAPQGLADATLAEIGHSVDRLGGTNSVPLAWTRRVGRRV